MDKKGRISLPPEVRTRLGLAGGVEILLEDAPNGVTLRRSAAHLAKIYIEPTSRCDLAYRMCIRNSWAEKQGEMSEATFQRLMENIEVLQDKPAVVCGGCLWAWGAIQCP